MADNPYSFAKRISGVNPEMSPLLANGGVSPAPDGEAPPPIAAAPVQAPPQPDVAPPIAGEAVPAPVQPPAAGGYGFARKITGQPAVTEEPPPPVDPMADPNKMPELAASNPNIENAGLGFKNAGKDFMIGLKLLTSSDPDKIADMLKDVDGMSIQYAGKVPYATFTGADGKRKSYSLNKAGMSMQDAAPFLTAALAAPFASKFARSLGLLAGVPMKAGGVAESAVGGALTSLGMTGAGHAQGADESPPTYLESAMLGGAGGVVGALLGTGAGKLVQKYGRGILDAAGNITAPALKAFDDARIDVRNLSRNVLQEIDDALHGKEISKSSVAGTMNNQLAAREGVSLTRGQATQDKALLDQEMAMYRGEKGGPAQEIMDGAFLRQREAVQPVVENAANRVAPGAHLGGSEATAGADLQAAMREDAGRLKAVATDSYKAFRDTAAQHGITLPGGNDPSGAIAQRLSVEMPELGRENTVVANLLDTVRARLGGDGSPVTIETYHGMEKILNNVLRENKDPTTLRAVRTMRDEISKWLDDGISGLSNAPGSAHATPAGPPGGGGAPGMPVGAPPGLGGPPPGPGAMPGVAPGAAPGMAGPGVFIGQGPRVGSAPGGGPNFTSSAPLPPGVTSPSTSQQAADLARQHLRDAQSAFRDYRTAYPPKGEVGDRGGKFAADAVNTKNDITGQEIFNRLAGGNNQITAAAEPVVAKINTLLGNSAPEVQNIKRHLLRRIVLGPTDKQATGIPPTYTSIVRRIDAALAGSGSNTSDKVLGQQGREALTELRALFKSMERNEPNPSGTSYRVNAASRSQFLSKVIGGLIGSAGGAVGALTGSPMVAGAGALGGAALGGKLAPMIADQFAASAARKAVQGYAAPEAGFVAAPVSSLMQSLQRLFPTAGAAAGAGLGAREIN